MKPKIFVKLFCIVVYASINNDIHSLVKYNAGNVEKMRSYDPADEQLMVEIGKMNLENVVVRFFQYSPSLEAREPGDFSRIKVINKNSKEFNFDNIDGWIKPYDPIEKYLTNDYFLELNIGGSEPVLIFFGYIYASLPGWLTIISLQGTKPEIIFNKELSLAKIVPNGDNYKLIICNDKHFIEDYYEEKYVKGKLISRKQKVKNPYKFCSEIYIENNELKVVPCTRTLADDEREELEEKKKINQVK